jgi:hypothetical protein
VTVSFSRRTPPRVLPTVADGYHTDRMREAGGRGRQGIVNVKGDKRNTKEKLERGF